uniref:Uncharacterized protein n=1 Tax=Micrurus spixii TaxID=129469 RepID=A0A2D4LPP8_9SAUR
MYRINFYPQLGENNQLSSEYSSQCKSFLSVKTNSKFCFIAGKGSPRPLYYFFPRTLVIFQTILWNVANYIEKICNLFVGKKANTLFSVPFIDETSFHLLLKKPKVLML